jgi:hypothetical protein
MLTINLNLPMEQKDELNAKNLYFVRLYCNILAFAQIIMPLIYYVSDADYFDDLEPIRRIYEIIRWIDHSIWIFFMVLSYKRSPKFVIPMIGIQILRQILAIYDLNSSGDN